MPSWAETAPSCIAPPADRAGSSSWSASTPPHSRWYCRALRSRPEETTGRPSSVKPSAPASRSSAMSVSCSPDIPRLMQGMKPSGTRASRRAISRIASSSGVESSGGSVFGIATTPQ